MRDYEEIRNFQDPLSLKKLNDQLRLLWFKSKNIIEKDIRNGAVTGEKIADNVITSQKIKANSITANSIDVSTIRINTANIEDAAVTNAKIDRASVNKLVVTNADIAEATIQGAKIADATITNAKIEDATIVGAKIADATIGTAQIATGAITTALIGTSAVETAQIADGSITDAKIIGLTANKITAGTINAADIDVINLKAANITVGTINGKQITQGSITDVNLADGAVKTDKIAVGAITADQIAADAITVDKIAVNAVGAEAIASGSILTDKLQALAVTGDKIAGETITANKLVANTITAASGVIADAAITNAKIADVDAAKITTGYLSSNRIQAGALTADKLNVISLSSISADLGTVTSGTITGATIQTSTGVDRLEMSGSSFKSYKAGTLRVELLPEKLNFTDSNGMLTGSIEAVPETDLYLSRLTLDAQDMIALQSKQDDFNYIEMTMFKPYDTGEFSSTGGFNFNASNGDATTGSAIWFNIHPMGAQFEVSSMDGSNGNFSMFSTDLNLTNGGIKITGGGLTLNTGLNRATLTMNGGFAIGSGNALDTTHGSRRSIQIATDINYGGTFDNHSGFLIYSTMSTGWGYSELHFSQSNNWGGYDENSKVVFQRGGAILMKGGSANGYAIRNIDIAQGSRPSILYGRTGSTSGAWVTVTHASNTFKSLITNNEQGIATKFQNVTSTSFQVCMSGTSTGTVDWVRFGQV